MARLQAGLSLSGMAKRTGYSRSYLGNVETGVRQATPDLVRVYERVIGGDVNRRQLLIASGLSVAVMGTEDQAVVLARQISQARSGLLTEAQTSHLTDRAVASLVTQDSGSLASLVKWSRSGSPVLRVNATGILAKVRSPLVDNEAIAALHDAQVQRRYLAAVLARVLSVPWEVASTVVERGEGLTGGQLSAMIGELGNPYDSGARWCAAVMLFRSRDNDHPAVIEALVAALRVEPVRDNLRAIGSALAGIDPLTI